jgi:hypothetical protein
MRRVLTVPEFDEPLAKLCAALRVMQVHRQERLVLEVVPSSSALASVEPDSAVGVLKVPVPEPGQEMEDFLAALEELSASAPDLSVMAMLPPPLSTAPGALDQASRWVRSLREAGADEFLPCEGTPMTLARRLETLLRSEFSTDFLQALASDLATQQWLVLSRFLKGLRDGVVLSASELARACQRDPEALCTAFRSEGLGSLDDWRCRGVVYGVFRRAEEEHISVRDAARGFGFGHLEDFDAVCRAGAGSPARQLEACGGWREVLQVLAERIDARFHGVDDDPREPAGAQRLGARETRQSGGFG